MRADFTLVRTELRTRYYRWMFLTAGAWNALAAAAILFLFTNSKLRAQMGISNPPDPVTLQLLAACLFLFGLGYYWVGGDLSNNHDLVKLGLIGKTIVFIVCFGHVLAGAFPLSLAIPSVGDLLFAVLFLEFLFHCRRKAQ